LSFKKEQQKIETIEKANQQQEVDISQQAKVNCKKSTTIKKTIHN